MNKSAIKAAAVLAVGFTCLFAVPFVWGAAATSGSPTILRFAASGDTFTPPSGANTGGVTNAMMVDTIAFTPVTTGSVYRLTEGTTTNTGAIIWETTATETRAVNSSGTVNTALGGLNKVVEQIQFHIPPTGLYFTTTDSSSTGLILYRRTGRQQN